MYFGNNIEVNKPKILNYWLNDPSTDKIKIPTRTTSTKKIYSKISDKSKQITK